MCSYLSDDSMIHNSPVHFSFFFVLFSDMVFHRCWWQVLPRENKWVKRNSHSLSWKRKNFVKSFAFNLVNGMPTRCRLIDRGYLYTLNPPVISCPFGEWQRMSVIDVEHSIYRFSIVDMLSIVESVVISFFVKGKTKTGIEYDNVILCWWSF